MNKNVSLRSLSKDELLAKLPKSISSTHILLMVISVILLGLTIYFVIAYFSAVSNKNDIDEQITQKQEQINSIGGMQNIAALQNQLDQALEDVIDQSPFPQQIDSTDVAYTIIQLARESSISCFQYNHVADSIADINGRSYIGNRYSIAVQGTTEATGERIVRLINFLEDLESAYDTQGMTGVGLSDGDDDGEWTIGFIYTILSLETETQ